MDSSTRRTCPSCQTRLSPLAAECPECGLALAPPRQGRPFLFQASALAQASFESSAKALTAPALGRVAAVAVDISPDELERPSAGPPLPEAAPRPHGALGFEDPVASFWPLVKVEATEALLLVLVQALALALPAWLAGVSPVRLLTGAWLLVVPYLLAVSWMLFMAPLVLTGRSPFMGRFGVTLPENTPERRMTFSLVHMLSVLCFPLSFLCMVLSPRHQTLAELLSGQELLARPVGRMR
mgnify:CR=1 FL=1